MPHFRIFRHYVHAPVLLMSFAEAILVGAAAYLGFYSRHAAFPPLSDYLPTAIIFGVVILAMMTAMGVQEARVREGVVGVALRTAVAIFLLGIPVVSFVFYLFPAIAISRGALLLSALEAFLLVTVFRWLIYSLLDEDLFKKRVLVLGIGHRAMKIAARMRRRYDQRAFRLIGFMDPNNASDDDQVSSVGAKVIRSDLPLPDYCATYDIHEVVVAMDERRRNRDASGGLPLEALMECRMTGVNVCDVQQFIEREAAKVDVDLLRPSWLVFSDGFVTSTTRLVTKRGFDLLASFLLVLVSWPIMLIAALLIKLETPELSILYRQKRVGLDGADIDVLKFRSMVPSVETQSQWTLENDPRITRVGRFIRKARIDELPQLFNVFKGDMSFVGPRPERPELVTSLQEKIPFYTERHRVKPGITGWAQLCYPYGASIEDAKEKLQYDLYYLKNQSLMLDLLILLQTVEVVLIGEGAR